VGIEGRKVPIGRNCDNDYFYAMCVPSFDRFKEEVGEATKPNG